MAPKCDQCELSNGMCPSVRKVTKASSSRARSKKIIMSASDPDAAAGPKIEVTLEEEEHKIALKTTSATRRTRRTSPEQLEPVKKEDTSP